MPELLIKELWSNIGALGRCNRNGLQYNDDQVRLKAMTILLQATHRPFHKYCSSSYDGVRRVSGRRDFACFFQWDGWIGVRGVFRGDCEVPM